MVKYRNVCAVINCQKNGSKEQLLMHSLDSNSKLGKIWYQRAKYGLCYYNDSENGNALQFEPSTKRIFICESHFNIYDYDNHPQDTCDLVLQKKRVRKRLKKIAIPSVNLPSDSDSKTSHVSTSLQDNNSVESLEFINLIDAAKDDILDYESEDNSNNLSNVCSKRILTQKTLKSKKRKKSYIVFPRSKKKSTVKRNDRESISSESDLRNHSETPSPPIVDASQQLNQTCHLIQSDKHCHDLMKSLYSDETLMDVFLTVDNRTAKAHRAILRQASGYFRQVLSLDTTLECEIRLRDIEYDVLVKILRFIYMGEVSMDRDMIPQFFKTAKILEIFSLIPKSREKDFDVTSEVKQEECHIILEEGEECQDPTTSSPEQTTKCRRSIDETYLQDQYIVIKEKAVPENASVVTIADADMAAPMPDFSVEHKTTSSVDLSFPSMKASYQCSNQSDHAVESEKIGGYCNNVEVSENEPKIGNCSS